MEAVDGHTEHRLIAVIKSIPHQQWYPSLQESTQHGALDETGILVLPRSLCDPGQGVDGQHSLLGDGATTQWQQFTERVASCLQ